MLGWYAIIGLQLTRKSVSSIGAHIQKLDSPLVAYGALMLSLGYLLGLVDELMGGLAW